jgi:outer membrane lipoprotein-sorting protein
MHRLVQILALAAALVITTGAGQQLPPPPRLAQLTDADRADLDKVSAYLSGIHALQGEFVQVGPHGEIDQGRFYLMKPGKLRFEYQAPSPLLIVSDGRTVAVFNSRLRTTDRYPLSATPLSLLLGEHIDLSHNDSIVRVVRQPGLLVVEARTTRSRLRGNLSITFAYPVLQLRQWTVIGDQGLPTTVALRNLQTGTTLNPSLFVLRDTQGVGTRPRN